MKKTLIKKIVLSLSLLSIPASVFASYTAIIRYDDITIKTNEAWTATTAKFLEWVNSTADDAYYRYDC